MYIFPVLQLTAGLLILIWMASLSSSKMFAVWVYYLEVGDDIFGVVVGNALYVTLTGDMTIVFLYCISQKYAGFSYVRKVAIFF